MIVEYVKSLMMMMMISRDSRRSEEEWHDGTWNMEEGEKSVCEVKSMTPAEFQRY